MAKSTSVFVRVEPQVKAQAESVLNQLGIPMSNAIALFLQQVILQRGMPFDLKLPAAKPIALGSLSDEQFNELMERGFADYAAGRVTDATTVRAEMNKKFDI